MEITLRVAILEPYKLFRVLGRSVQNRKYIAWITSLILDDSFALSTSLDLLLGTQRQVRRHPLIRSSQCSREVSLVTWGRGISLISASKEKLSSESFSCDMCLSLGLYQRHTCNTELRACTEGAYKKAFVIVASCRWWDIKVPTAESCSPPLFISLTQWP